MSAGISRLHCHVRIGMSCAHSRFLDLIMRSAAGQKEKAADKRMAGQNRRQMAEQGLGAKPGKKDVGSRSGWLSVNSSERMKLTIVESKRA